MTPTGDQQQKEPSAQDWSSPLWGAKAALAIDQTSTATFHIQATALMETAGRCVAVAAQRQHPRFKQVVVLAGTGNNGADGLVAARVLFESGWITKVFIVRSTSGKSSELFELQLKSIQALEIPHEEFRAEALECFRHENIVIIDALTGAGFLPPLSQASESALTAISQLPFKHVIAVDLPSGLASDDGTTTKIPLAADETVTFGAAKPAHKILPSASLCGNVYIEDIGFPHAAIQMGLKQSPPMWRLANKQQLMALDPWNDLDRTANKYDRGHILVIGGSAGKLGAPILAGLAALRAGAGWSSIAAPRSEIEPDVKWPLELTMESFFDGQNIDQIKFEGFLTQRRVKSVVIGPGWMTNHLTRDTLSILVKFCENGGKVVIDAGGLHQILELIHKVGPLPKNSFALLPHPGEWLKLSGDKRIPGLPEPLTPIGVSVIQKLTQDYNLTICHKGATPIVSSESLAPSVVCDFGSAVMARAGSGDILSGIVAAHLAMGCSPLFAICRGYAVLTEAARAAAQAKGFHAVLPSDIINLVGLPKQNLI